MRVRLTCVEDGSSKFWEGSVEGATLTVRFGRIGTAGQTKVKDFPSAAAADKELQKVAADKRKKGYVDDVVASAAPVAPPAAARAELDVLAELRSVWPAAIDFEAFVQDSASTPYELELGGLLGGCAETGSDGGGNIWICHVSPGSGRSYVFCLDHETSDIFSATWPLAVWAELADDGELPRDTYRGDEAVEKIERRVLPGVDHQTLLAEGAAACHAWERTTWLVELIRGATEWTAAEPESGAEDFERESAAAHFADSGAGALYWALAFWARGDTRAAEVATRALSSQSPLIRDGARIVMELVAGERTALAGVDLVATRARWQAALVEHRAAAQRAGDRAAREAAAKSEAERAALGAWTGSIAAIKHLEIGWGTGPGVRLDEAASLETLETSGPVPATIGALATLRELVAYSPGPTLPEVFDRLAALRSLTVHGDSHNKPPFALPSTLGPITHLMLKSVTLAPPADATWDALAHVEDLTLEYCHVDAATLARLIGLPRLRAIAISEYEPKVPVKDVSALAGRRLERVALTLRGKKPPKGFDKIAAREVQLDATNTKSDVALAACTKLQGVERLGLRCDLWSGPLPDGFAALSSLRGLELGCGGLPLPSSVYTLTQLEALHLEYAPAELGELGAFTRLRSLVLEGKSVRVDDRWVEPTVPAAAFAPPGLEHLRLRGFMAPTDARGWGEPPATLRSLSLEYVSGALPTWIGARPLTTLMLQSVAFGRGKDDAAQLAKLAGLTELTLENTGFEAPPEALYGMAALTSLKLVGMAITPDHLSRIAALPALRRLELSVDYTPRALDALAKLRGLQRLVVTTPSWGGDAIDALRQTLPATRVSRI